MKKIIDLGQMVEISLDDLGYNGYSVACLYRPSEVRGKYTVRLTLTHKGKTGNTDGVSFIGTSPNGEMLYWQDITSNSGTIKNDLYRIVKYMCDEKLIEGFMEGVK